MEEMFYIAKAAACISAALAIGIGTIAPANSQGNIASRALENMGKYPELASNLRTTAFATMGIVETSVVFAFIISLVLLFI